ncbi:MAG: hypothetical protein AABW79_04035 [Nanoarchaeota archaeon]|mgnify:CR=1 FL=1
MDYSKLGFKAGLEIHQQLDSEKLFSGAPSYLRSDKPDYTVVRKLHAVAGESGEIDEAVAHEASLEREFHYEGYKDTISLVELDEEPPKMIGEKALEICLEIALLLNCEIYPASQIMRKTVIDGSNTSGFQRTVLIGHDGFLETSFGNVAIESVALEEDSARLISRDAKKAIFRLDRLGIPLVEIGTAPELYSAEQVKEAALKLGEILRACRVKRGIGTIRQDVNVSIKGHERVEIKGFQDPAMMVATIDKEVERQTRDLKEKKISGSVRNALANGETEFMRPLPGKARMYPETDLPLLKIGLEKINKIKKNLPKLKTQIRDELKKKGLGDELINLVLDSRDYLDSFTTLCKIYSKDANLVAKMVTLWRAEIAGKNKKTIDDIENVLSERMLEKILELVKAKKIDISDVKQIMVKLSEGVAFENAIKIEKLDANGLEEFVVKLIRDRPGLRANAYMGQVMAHFKGKIDAKKAMEIIERSLKV